jgi:hypothetical protein
MRGRLNKALMLFVCLAFPVLMAACSSGSHEDGVTSGSKESNISTGGAADPEPLSISGGDSPFESSTEALDAPKAGDPLAAGEPRMEGPEASGPLGGSQSIPDPLMAGSSPLDVSDPIGDEPVGGGPPGQ